MSEYRRQVHIDAPLEVVWGFVGSPSRYPEWWPRVVEVRGERFEEGDEYAPGSGRRAGCVLSRVLA